ncbi:hypothetical protein PIB30_116457, partial [Stylosanthes scabra]|nr:hypothetical protein [Stylosanthes scabra]
MADAGVCLVHIPRWATTERPAVRRPGAPSVGPPRVVGLGWCWRTCLAALIRLPRSLPLARTPM